MWRQKDKRLAVFYVRAVKGTGNGESQIMDVLLGGVVCACLPREHVRVQMVYGEEGGGGGGVVGGCGTSQRSQSAALGCA